MNQICGKTQRTLKILNKLVEALGSANHNKRNKFMPTYEQVQKCPDIRHLSIRKWKKYTDNHSIKENLYKQCSDYKKSSLRKRMESVANQIIKKDGTLKKLFMFDGHGRATNDLIDILKKNNILWENINNKITIVEIDKTVHDWHAKFLPRGINVVHSDIFDEHKLSLKGHTIGDDDVVYLNFCSLGSDVALHDIIYKFIINRPPKTTIISFAKCRGKVQSRKVINFMDKIKLKRCMKPIELETKCQGRSEFHTYMII
jgi:hypothetical protein